MSSIASPELLIALSRHRWAVPVLAHMAAHRGGRFAEMANRLGIPRDSLKRTLTTLIEEGWIAPNPGHGHPLRPDYLLGEAGHRVALACRAIAEAQAQAGMPPEAVTRWSLPLLHLLETGEARFNRLERAMTGATPRAVAASLKALIRHDLVVRDIVEGFPPSSAYRLTRRGEAVAKALC